MERRVTLALVLSLVLIFGYQIVLSKLRPAPPPKPADSNAGAPVEPKSVEAPEGSGAETPPKPDEKPVPPAEPAVAVETDAPDSEVAVDSESFRVVFTGRGGAIQKILLKAPYLRSRKADPNDPNSWFPVVDAYEPSTLSAVLVDPSGRMALDARNWELESPPARAASGGQTLTFRYQARNGLVFRKTFTVPDQGYHVGVTVNVSSAATGGPEPGSRYRLFLRGVAGMSHEFPKQSLVDGAVVAAYAHGGDEELTVEKLLFGDLRKATGAKKEVTVPRLRWIATLDKYFVTVLRPEKPEEWLHGNEEGEAGFVALTPDVQALAAARELSQKAPAPPAPDQIELMSKTRVSGAILVPFAAQLPGKSVDFPFLLFAGPRDPHLFDSREEYKPLERVVDLGFTGGCGLDFIVKPIAKILLFLLEAIHSLVGNWGIAIILLTVLVRLIILPISLRQQVVMTAYSQRMGKIKPEMEKLQAKYKTNRQRLNQEMMKLYKEKGINPVPPLGGCLPLFITMPVFLGLYYVFSTSLVMRQSPFLWIDDLSQPDRALPFGHAYSIVCFELDAINVLPILMAATWWVQQKLAPKPTDPQMQQQQKMLQWMPFLFLFMLYGNAAGLSLYWFVNSALGILETQFVRKKFMAKPGDAPAAGALAPAR